MISYMDTLQTKTQTPTFCFHVCVSRYIDVLLLSLCLHHLSITCITKKTKKTHTPAEPNNQSLISYLQVTALKIK